MGDRPIGVHIDENTEYGRVLVVHPEEAAVDLKEMRVLNDALPDSQELFDLLDYFEATYEVDSDYLPGGLIPAEDLEFIDEDILEEEE